MPYPDHQLWALAVAGPIMELEKAHLTELGGWGLNEHTRAWCKNTLANLYGISSRAELEAQLKQRLGGAEHPAWDAAIAVALSGWGYWAEYLGELEAWQIILFTAARVQAQYDSWAAFAAGYERGRRAWRDVDHPPTAQALDKLLHDPASPWVRLPWSFDLGVQLTSTARKPRFKKTRCPTCGAPKQRPSQTGYVYCDYCGALADYDFAKACEQPLSRPGPVYEALLARLRPALVEAQQKGDAAAYRALQEELFAAWTDACPGAVPPRVKDPAYRKKYVAWLAAGAVASGFDAEAQKLEAAVAQATTQLAFVQVGEKQLRVDPKGFDALAEAVLAQQAYVDRLYAERGVHALHPDGAAPELLARMGLSMFVQGWLPLLDETRARQLIERARLQSEYLEADPPPAQAAKCGGCGGELALVEGARRVVCEGCGAALDAAAERVRCSGCGAGLVAAVGAERFACPYCKVALTRVQLMTPA